MRCTGMYVSTPYKKYIIDSIYGLYGWYIRTVEETPRQPTTGYVSIRFFVFLVEFPSELSQPAGGTSWEAFLQVLSKSNFMVPTYGQIPRDFLSSGANLILYILGQKIQILVGWVVLTLSSRRRTWSIMTADSEFSWTTDFQWTI